jgi:hypothetical protein
MPWAYFEVNIYSLNYFIPLSSECKILLLWTPDPDSTYSSIGADIA